MTFYRTSLPHINITITTVITLNLLSRSLECLVFIPAVKSLC